MKKTLVRSSRDKKISGVCGGLANYLNIDSTLIRIAFVLFTFVGGFGLLLYIIAILLMPMDYEVHADPLKNTTYAQTNAPNSAHTSTTTEQEAAATDSAASNADTDPSASHTQQNTSFTDFAQPASSETSSSKKSPGASVTIGIALITIGLVFLAGIFFPQFNVRILFAAGIVALGVLFITRGGK